MPSRRAPDDIVCIALLEAYAPWAQTTGPADGIAQNVDAVELVVEVARDGALVAPVPRGVESLSRILNFLEPRIRLLVHVPDKTTALRVLDIVSGAHRSHQTTLAANRLSILRAASTADRRIATALLTESPEAAKEAAHRALVDALICTPEVADDELMVLSWQRRIRVYVGPLDTREEISEWIEKGADGIRTRRPDVYFQALGPTIIP